MLRQRRKWLESQGEKGPGTLENDVAGKEMESGLKKRCGRMKSRQVDLER
jgi:hypothetical protein